MHLSKLNLIDQYKHKHTKTHMDECESERGADFYVTATPPSPSPAAVSREGHTHTRIPPHTDTSHTKQHPRSPQETTSTGNSTKQVPGSLEVRRVVSHVCCLVILNHATRTSMYWPGFKDEDEGIDLSGNLEQYQCLGVWHEFEDICVVSWNITFVTRLSFTVWGSRTSTRA